MSLNKIDSIKSDMKLAMKSGDKDRLATIRLILSQVKQFEVDKKITVNNITLHQILNKMAKLEKRVYNTI